VKYLKELLDEIGVGGERLEMYNVSSADGPEFAHISKEMTERIRKLGPNPVRLGAVRDIGEDMDALEAGVSAPADVEGEEISG
jgi:hypothetical protein